MRVSGRVIPLMGTIGMEVNVQYHVRIISIGMETLVLRPNLLMLNGMSMMDIILMVHLVQVMCFMCELLQEVQHLKLLLLDVRVEVMTLGQVGLNIAKIMVRDFLLIQDLIVLMIDMIILNLM